MFNGDKVYIDSFDRRVRVLQMLMDLFMVVMGDVVSCIKLLEEIGVELVKEEEENVKNVKQRDVFIECGVSVCEVEWMEVFFQR